MQSYAQRVLSKMIKHKVLTKMTLTKEDIIIASVWIDETGLTHRESVTSLSNKRQASKKLASKVADELELIRIESKSFTKEKRAVYIKRKLNELEQTLRGNK